MIERTIDLEHQVTRLKSKILELELTIDDKERTIEALRQEVRELELDRSNVWQDGYTAAEEEIKNNLY